MSGAAECDFDAEEIEREEQLARRRAEEEVRTLKLLFCFYVIRSSDSSMVNSGVSFGGVSPLKFHLPDPQVGRLCGRVGFSRDRTEADPTDSGPT